MSIKVTRKHRRWERPIDVFSTISYYCRLDLNDEMEQYEAEVATWLGQPYGMYVDLDAELAVDGEVNDTSSTVNLEEAEYQVHDLEEVQTPDAQPIRVVEPAEVKATELDEEVDEEEDEEEEEPRMEQRKIIWN
jgi:hypothetical protein